MNKNNLYLTAFYTAQPRDPSKTKVKGYIKDPKNIVYTEKVEMSLGVKASRQAEAGVILDLTERKVLKNKFNPTADFEEVVKYYCTAYPDYLKAAGFTLEEAQDEPQNVQATEEPVPTETQEGS